MKPMILIIQRLFIVAGLLMLASCTDADHAMNHSAAEHDAMSHEGHVMEPSDEAGFTDGSLYQVSSTWTTQDSLVIPFGDLRGRIVVMAMTYTSCEFSCPLIVADMKKIINQVPAGERQRVRLVLLSIDPARDTPAVMKAFAAKTKLPTDQWTLLRGDAGDVMEMAALLGVRYKEMPDGEFSHSNIITLLNTEGEVVHQQNGLGPEMTAATIESLQRLLSAGA